MPSIPFLLICLLLHFSFSVSAHKEPKSSQEIEIQRALQAAAYHARTLSHV